MYNRPSFQNTTNPLGMSLKYLSFVDFPDLSVVQASRQTGCVEVEDVLGHIRQDSVSTCLITIMMANNETGIIQVGKSGALH
jgi:hypothetical protein